MNYCEILAPSGSMESLKAAVFSGADAVYIGASSFSARASATNFSNEELKQAADFCRLNGVRLFITVNTLVKDSEIKSVMDLCKFLCSVSVDAVIVQDMGLFYLIKKSCPNLNIHCSTQMSISSLEATKLVTDLGAKRVVLARELSFKEIEHIKSNSNTEIEVFVHGALCVSVSGQCYFSAILGSRSGNRGRCAQPCRLPFKINNGNGFDLSLKDLSVIDYVNKLKEIGVDSLKIEGRMKRPEYVAAAVTAVRDSLQNGKYDNELKSDLTAVFSRTGFTDAYLMGKIQKDMFGYRRKEDVKKADSAVFSKLHALYNKDYKRVKLDMKIELFNGQKVKVYFEDEDLNSVFIESDVKAELGVNKTLSSEDIKDRFSKLGGTPYYVGEIIVKTDEVSILPASELNLLRREGIKKLSQLRVENIPIEFTEADYTLQNRKSENFEYRAEFRSLEQVPENLDRFSMIYFPLFAPISHFETLMRKNIKIAAVLPRISFGDSGEVRNRVNTLIDLGIKDYLCGNLYGVQILREFDVTIHGSYSLNIMNSYSLKQFEELGVKEAEVSVELTENETANLKSNNKRGIMIYGRQAMMLLRHCPHNIRGKKCSECSGKEEIIDRYDIGFPVLCSKYKYKDGVLDNSTFYTEIMNNKPTYLNKLVSKNNLDYGIFRFTTESKDEVIKIIEGHFEKQNNEIDKTNGLYYRGVL